MERVRLSRWPIAVLVCSLLASLSGCSVLAPAQPTATPQPTPTPEPTSTPTPVPTATNTPTPAPTATPTPNLAATAAVISTEVAQLNATATARAAQATAQVKPMYDALERLKKEGAIRSTDGDYDSLDDYEATLAQLNYFSWSMTTLRPYNFVFRANLAMEMATKTANAWTSGCGIVFRMSDDGKNMVMILFALDGFVYFYIRSGGGDTHYISRGQYGTITGLSTSAPIMVVVENEWTRAYVNEKRVATMTHYNNWVGKFGFHTASGINTDFGTRCKMTDVELYTLYIVK